MFLIVANKYLIGFEESFKFMPSKSPFLPCGELKINEAKGI